MCLSYTWYSSADRTNHREATSRSQQPHTINIILIISMMYIICQVQHIRYSKQTAAVAVELSYLSTIKKLRWAQLSPELHRVNRHLSVPHLISAG